MEAWKKYAEQSFSEVYSPWCTCSELRNISHIDGNVPPGKLGKAPSTVQLGIDEDGIPILPEMNPTNRKDMAATVRQLLTAYYRELNSIVLLSGG